MFKIKFWLILLILFCLLLPNLVFAQEETIQEETLNVYFFWGLGCPHCAKEKTFLEKIEQTYPQVKVIDFEVYNNIANAQLLNTLEKELHFEVRGVPFVIIGDKSLVGFLNEETTGKQIQAIIEQCLEGCVDVIEPIINHSAKTEPLEPLPKTTEDNMITLPFLGEIDPQAFSLPILTIVIAALDGFNPCAMWVLLFLISLLLGMANKKRMWTLGITFIVVSGIVYFFFLSAWLNLFLFIGFIFWVRILIGLVAMSSGGYHLWEFYKNRPGCKVVKGERRERIFTNLKFITKIDKFWLALIGIIIIAFAVNLIELVCSAGLPAIYTNVLSLSNLPAWQYYLLLILYIIIFMLDDMFVFVVAMVTLQATGLSTKYTRYSNLIGGIIILILGILLILKPQWLMFS